ESGFNTKIAHALIYKHPLFIVWLGALCLNLFAVTLTRWPWQKKHIGFVVTHYGIITLLVGAMIGMQTGFEGNVTLRKDAAPVSRVTTSRSVIQLESPADSALYLMGFDAEATPPSAAKPRIFPVPGTKLQIVADEFNANLLKEQRFIASDTVDAAPSVLLRLSSKVAGQTLERPFTLTGGKPAEEDFFGLARIAFRPALPAVAPPADQETQMVFAKFAPVVEPGKSPTGLSVRLSADGAKVTIQNSAGVGATYLRSEIMNQPVTETGAVVIVEKYWPDFAMENGQPVSKSDSPNNPAALVRITPTSQTAPAKPSLEMAPAADGVAYQLLRGGHVAASGTVKPGDTFALGWADWQAEVLQVLPAAVLVSETKPGPKLPKEAPPGIPGFRARLETPGGARGPDRWVESGQVTSLTDGNNVVRVAYGLESKPLPFSLRLLNFEIPRDEGTDSPANFLATVEFQDAKTGATKTGVAKMNHPASFPGTVAANLTGINYKFSQAEWNPKNLDETTLQVLYDPGWLLKWLGSLGIVVGISIMFYWKPSGR
ncbi:MAG: cytochrome C biogenesis protein ResB, partial [Terrimicrobiaceae bacterium]